MFKGIELLSQTLIFLSLYLCISMSETINIQNYDWPNLITAALQEIPLLRGSSLFINDHLLIRLLLIVLIVYGHTIYFRGHVGSSAISFASEISVIEIPQWIILDQIIKVEISKVNTIRLQRYSDLKIRLCG